MESSTETTTKPSDQQKEQATDKSRIQQLASQLTRDREEHSKKRKIRRWVLWILLLGIAVAGYFLWQAYRPTPVTTSVVSYQRIGSAAQPVLRLSGFVTYPRIAVISAQIQTPVTRLNFAIGDRVQEGDILAEFDHSELLARRQVQQITVGNLEATLQRVQNLYNGGAASDADLQNARTQLAEGRANLELLNTQIENSIIRAPFSGIIIDKMVEVGEVATQGICRLADNAQILVAVDVNQEDIAKVTPQSSAVVSLDAYPQTEYAADIYEIMPSADPAKNTIQVKVGLLHPDDRFKPNMSAKVFFTNQDVTENAPVKAVLTVDKAAILKQNDGPKLLVIQNGRIRERPVELGISVGDRLVEIKSGVQPDQRVVLNPQQYRLKAGDRVTIQ